MVLTLITDLVDFAVYVVLYTLRRLGLTNWIVDDSDFKQSKFKWQNPSDSKTDIKIVSYFIVAIYFRSLFYLFLIKFDQLLIKFDQLLNKIRLKCQLKDCKWLKLIKNGQNWLKKSKSIDFFDQFWLNLIFFISFHLFPLNWLDIKKVY